MADGHILVVDDEQDILDLVDFNLRKEGFRVSCVTSGEAALADISTKQPNLILLDLMLPGIDGLDLCRSLKSDPRTKDIPIVFLSARGDEADIVAGLELGADDYVTKPFSPRVLVARLKNVLKRKRLSTADEHATVTIERLVIDPIRHEATANGTALDLTVTEFRLLHFLARHPGWVFTRYQIVDAVKGEDYPVTDRSVDVQMVGLRKKLGELGKLIETVRGVGYRFKG